MMESQNLVPKRLRFDARACGLPGSQLRPDDGGDWSAGNLKGRRAAHVRADFLLALATPGQSPRGGPISAT
jgi:hypothetical protein